MSIYQPLAPAGSSNDIQLNLNGGFGVVTGFSWVSGELQVPGDIWLNDGGTFTTTWQLVTPTANRTQTFPDASGTVALVAGSSGQVMFNNAGALGGLPSLTADAENNLTFSRRWIQSTNGAASASAHVLTGTWFTGGTSTTTKPQFLIEPAGTTSTNWSTAGTGLGVNAPSGFAGRIFDFQSNGVPRLVLSSEGNCSLGGTTFPSRFYVEHSDVNVATFRGVGNALCEVTNGIGVLRFQILSNTPTLFSASNHSLFLGSNNTVRMQIKAGGGFYISDGNDYELGTATGTKIGTATTQKLAFYNATPIVQPAAVADATDNASAITQLNLALARLRSLGLIAT